MTCTTILVGKKASYDGSTIIARTEDSQNGVFCPKKFEVIKSEAQPKHYRSVLSNFEIDLPDNPLSYTSVPNALDNEGIWAEAGINAANVAMSATETITTNARVLGADPLVASGIGEEDMLTLVLPYIQSAREGVERLGKLLEEYGTYESNGIAFSDINEIWWLETIGGHHWIARRVPDDAYVTNPNQLGIDHFEFNNPDDYRYSNDLKDFIADNHLDLTYSNEHFNPRYAFGSQKDKDRHYNTPRSWAIQRFLNPEIEQDPRSFFIPWCQKPYRKITVEDIKYVLSNHYQDTNFDPYGSEGDRLSQTTFRTIGINRTSQTALLQLRPNQTPETRGIQWLSYGSMPFNTMVPFFTQVSKTPAYFANTSARVTTDNFYWTNRLIAALADSHYHRHEGNLEAYVEKTMAAGHAMIHRVDEALAKGEEVEFEGENQAMSDFIEEQTQVLLEQILFDASNLMTNRYGVSD
ncbi:C69 family dipeptidase [Streptococcus mutans]|uniref:C69 family dipeptidase n=1 Tax=Streptococcus mutans TaxID=1309 RepID=UPI0002B54146|nr:C69 family dipeptidase [Streptococcus mutans]AMF85207.1 peptidase C69 [Streptococcus mutans]EMC13081.1 putative dipeptidase [Streptococcus mutans N3209]MCB4952386.1 C69 family dipeptidase [Streptococcus mutans]MCB5024619.1 C69 family dipeptidase [Streptococcus mutans]MCB5053573.1 C69 family dipeptidase [Streptococcus mutans]